MSWKDKLDEEFQDNEEWWSFMGLVFIIVMMGAFVIELRRSIEDLGTLENNTQYTVRTGEHNE